MTCAQASQYPVASLQKTLKIVCQSVRILCELDQLTWSKMIHKSVPLGGVLCTAPSFGKGTEKLPGWGGGYLSSLSQDVASGWLFMAGVPSDGLFNISYLFYPRICTLYFRDHCSWLPFPSPCEKQLTKSLLLSVLEKAGWLSVSFSWSGRAVTKFFYTFTREKAIVCNWFQPLSCWLSELLFLVLEEGSVKLLHTLQALVTSALILLQNFCY